jgi:hypothetical protein
MASHVEAMDAGVITAGTIATDAIDADAVAASAVAEIQAGLATIANQLAIAAGIAAVQADTDDLQTRVPAALVGGRMDSSVGAMAANVVTAGALAADAVDEIVDQVWNEILADHLAAGSTGKALADAAVGGGGGGDPAAVWQEPKSAHQGETIMGNIAEDVDNLEFTGQEG